MATHVKVVVMGKDPYHVVVIIKNKGNVWRRYMYYASDRAIKKLDQQLDQLKGKKGYEALTKWRLKWSTRSFKEDENGRWVGIKQKDKEVSNMKGIVQQLEGLGEFTLAEETRKVMGKGGTRAVIETDKQIFDAAKKMFPFIKKLAIKLEKAIGLEYKPRLAESLRKAIEDVLKNDITKRRMESFKRMGKKIHRGEGK